MHREWMNWVPFWQVKWRPENYWALVLTTTSISFSSANHSLSQWPKCTALLFCFYIIHLELWQGSVPPILWGRDVRENTAESLHPLTTEPMETQKYQIIKTKFGEARGKNFLLLYQEGKPKHSGKHFIFQVGNLKNKWSWFFLFWTQICKSHSRDPILFSVGPGITAALVNFMLLGFNWFCRNSYM